MTPNRTMSIPHPEHEEETSGSANMTGGLTLRVSRKLYGTSSSGPLKSFGIFDFVQAHAQAIAIPSPSSRNTTPQPSLRLFLASTIPPNSFPFTITHPASSLSPSAPKAIYPIHKLGLIPQHQNPVKTPAPCLQKHSRKSQSLGQNRSTVLSAEGFSTVLLRTLPTSLEHSSIHPPDLLRRISIHTKPQSGSSTHHI